MKQSTGIEEMSSFKIDTFHVLTHLSGSGNSKENERDLTRSSQLKVLIKCMIVTAEVSDELSEVNVLQ